MILLEQLLKRHAGFPLGYIKDWSQKSFKFDAISILAILGAGEVDQAVGTLTRRRYTEYLPLLAGQVIASNSFTSSVPGFTMYNLSDGIKHTELNGSFARILMSVPTTKATTIITWEPVEHRAKSRLFGIEIMPVILSLFFVSPLLTCTILMGDWYGVCNACAIIVSIVCRLCLVSQLRRSRENMIHPGSWRGSSTSRSIIMRPDARMITCIAPRQILLGLLSSAEVEHLYIYKTVRRIAWLALSVHLCTLNMCTLFSQIYTIALLGSSTWVMNTAWAFDTGLTMIGNQGSGHDTERTYRYSYSEDLDLYVTLPPIVKTDSYGDRVKLDRRLIAWTRLSLNEEEESLLRRWNVMPPQENREWWGDYNKEKDEFLTQTAGSRAPSAPRTPQSLALPMDPPPTSHSRRSSLGSQMGNCTSVRRSVSPSPSMPFPAVMPSASPSVSGSFGVNVRNADLYAASTLPVSPRLSPTQLPLHADASTPVEPHRPC